MAERIFITKRSAGRQAIQLLFADDSDEEPAHVDEEDMSFFEADYDAGLDETVISTSQAPESDERPTTSTMTGPRETLFCNS